MSVNTEDIEEAVKQLWAAVTPALPSLILGRVDQAASSPYTSFKVTDGPTERTATGGYLQTFTVEFRTWDETSAVHAGTVKAAIEAAFGIQTRTTLTLASGRTLKILHSVKV